MLTLQRQDDLVLLLPPHCAASLTHDPLVPVHHCPDLGQEAAVAPVGLAEGGDEHGQAEEGRGTGGVKELLSKEIGTARSKATWKNENRNG